MNKNQRKFAASGLFTVFATGMIASNVAGAMNESNLDYNLDIMNLDNVNKKENFEKSCGKIQKYNSFNEKEIENLNDEEVKELYLRFLHDCCIKEEVGNEKDRQEVILEVTPAIEDFIKALSQYELILIVNSSKSIVLSKKIVLFIATSADRVLTNKQLCDLCVSDDDATLELLVYCVSFSGNRWISNLLCGYTMPWTIYLSVVSKIVSTSTGLEIIVNLLQNTDPSKG